MQSATNPTKVLGKVTAPSGNIMLIDFGLMDLWTHDRPPLIPDGALNEKAMSSANNGADFTIEGPDALAAGKKFDRQPHPLFLYDIPRHGVEEIKENFDSLIKRAGLQANLVELPARISPLKRAENVISHHDGGGEVFLHGIHAIVVPGIPKGQTLSVEGCLMGEGQFAQNWKNISLVVTPGAEVASSKKIGHVAVDMARLMFCDLDAMGKWEHQDTIDGLADFVFWGKDALRICNKFGGTHIDSGIYGFVDKPIMEMAELAVKVRKHLEHHRLVAATDFRPHSDHWRMLKSVSENDTESGEIELGDARCCGFMTTWGDGFFPVFLDSDADGKLARIRIELGTEEAVQGMHMVNRFA